MLSYWAYVQFSKGPEKNAYTLKFLLTFAQLNSAAVVKCVQDLCASLIVGL